MGWFKNEAEAVAHDMSLLYGGRWSADGASYEDGVKFEFIATPSEKEFAAISRLRWLMGAGDGADECDCGHLFDLDGSVTRYSLLDLDLDYARGEAEALAGGAYEGEAKGIIAEVLGRRPEFLRAARGNRLLRRNNYNFEFKVIDKRDCEEIGSSRRKGSEGASNAPSPLECRKNASALVETCAGEDTHGERTMKTPKKSTGKLTKKREKIL
ncbi:MAG: hypothetical protein LBL45_07570, partial [Treponema sp.]|nr:hypothetical protein [Treponema sp.]